MKKQLMFLFLGLIILPSVSAKLYIHSFNGPLARFDQDTGEELSLEIVIESQETESVEVTSIKFNETDPENLYLFFKGETLWEHSHHNAGGPNVYDLLLDDAVDLKPYLDLAVKSNKDYHLYVPDTKRGDSNGSVCVLYDSRLGNITYLGDFDYYSFGEKTHLFYRNLYTTRFGSFIGVGLYEFFHDEEDSRHLN
jgi:hypothetical protein